MPLLSYSANDVDAAGVAVDRELPAAWLDAELADTDAKARAPGHISARLSRSGDDIVVKGRATAALTLPCARCLDPANVDVDGEIALFLSPKPTALGSKPRRGGGKTHANGHARGHGKEPEEPEVELSHEDAAHDEYDGETVVLDGFVREAILLELPNFPLCSETCPGIGPRAADVEMPAGKRPDKRLAPLAALRAKLPPKPSAKKKTKE